MSAPTTNDHLPKIEAPVAAGTNDRAVLMDVRSARNANRVANQIRRQWPGRPEAAKAARDLRDAAMRSARSRRAALSEPQS